MRRAALVVMVLASLAPRVARADAPVSLAVTNCDAPGFADLRAATQLALRTNLVGEGTGGSEGTAASAFCIGLVVEARVVRPGDLLLFSRVLDLRRTAPRARARLVAAALASLLAASREGAPGAPRVVAPAQETAEPGENGARSAPPAAPSPSPAAPVADRFVAILDAGPRVPLAGGAGPYWGTGLAFGAHRGSVGWLVGARLEFGNEAGVTLGALAFGSLHLRTERGPFTALLGVGLRAGWLGPVDPVRGAGNALGAPSLSAGAALRVHARVAATAQLEQGIDLHIRTPFSVTPWLLAALGLQVTIP